MLCVCLRVLQYESENCSSVSRHVSLLSELSEGHHGMQAELTVALGPHPLCVLRLSCYVRTRATCFPGFLGGWLVEVRPVMTERCTANAVKSHAAHSAPLPGVALPGAAGVA